MNCVAVAKRCQQILWGAEAGFGCPQNSISLLVKKLNGTSLGPMNLSFIVCELPREGDVTLGNMASFC